VGRAIADGGLPPRWGLKQDQLSGTSRRILWFGKKRIALDDITSVAAEEVREKPVAGLVMAACIFVLVAMILAFGVFEMEWRERFLLGTAFLAFLGITGLLDTSTIKAQRYFEVKIATGGQGTVTFASADVDEVEALLGALAAAGVKA
jgi:Family of unknown function (DUF6232)